MVEALVAHANGDCPGTQTSPVSVLIVDDVEDNLDVLEALLGCPEIRLLRARSGPEALELLLAHDDVAVALLDVKMPVMDGFELAELMRGAERTRHVPIIFLTAGAPESAPQFRGYEAGAVDFLYKPLDIALLRSKVTVFLQLFRHRQCLAAQLEEHRQLLRTTELMLGVLGHDLRTPLGAIVTSAEVLRLKAGDDPQVARVAEALHSSSRRMTRLISQLLAFGAARLGNLPMVPRPCDLAVLAREAIEEFPDRQRFELRAEGDTHGTWDADRLAQVVSNLLGNALQHGTCEEVVRLRVDGESAGEVICTVSNGGTMPDDVAATLFVPFSPSSAATRGTGLGLSIVEHVVRAHGGTVSGASSDGRTTFTVRLPRHATADPNPSRPAIA